MGCYGGVNDRQTKEHKASGKKVLLHVLLGLALFAIWGCGEGTRSRRTVESWTDGAPT